MHSQTLTSFLLAAGLAAAIPVQDSPRERLRRGLDLPQTYKSVTGGGVLPFRRTQTNNPYTPEHRDPLDKAVDSIGDELDPLPYRNGLGASVLGPWNKERSRQNPDLVRPPSTDHGVMPNMRWSFADSHIRIEVSQSKNDDMVWCNFSLLFAGGWLDPRDHDQGAAFERRARQREHAPRPWCYSRAPLAQGS